MFERYSEMLKERGVKNIDVSRATGIPASTFSDWKKGKSSPKRDKIEKIAEFFEINPDWLAGTSDFKTNKEMLEHFDKKSNLDVIKGQMIDVQENTTRIKVLGKVAAGVPTHMQDEYVIGYEDVSNDMIKDDNVFGLEINGDSMSPRILKGDVVIVREQNDAESGDVVIVSINGDEATCKRLMKYATGISLISFNPAYEPMTFSNKEIEEKPVRIIGKVIENRSKF